MTQLNGFFFYFEVLKYFHFGENFIKWVKIFYRDSSTIMQNAGYLSRLFKNSRSLLSRRSNS